MKPGGQKKKGTRLEQAVVDDLNAVGIRARRQPGSGIYRDFPHDVEFILRGQRYVVECKSRKEGFKQLDGWLGAADVLVIKVDRGEPRLHITWSAFLQMLGDAHADEEAGCREALAAALRELDAAAEPAREPLRARALDRARVLVGMRPSPSFSGETEAAGVAATE